MDGLNNDGRAREDEMKIDDVELTLFSWDDIPPTRYTPGSQNVTGRSNLGFLRIATDDGIEGHALLGSAINPAETDAGALIRFVKPVLMGKDPLAREDLHAAMTARQRSTGLRVIGACDTALWDIGAKAAGMPLYKFLGGGRAEIGAYASSQMLEDAEAYAQEAARFKADGWKGYKIHPPQSPLEDIKVCEAVRKAVGDDFTLMLDSTWSYRYPDAVRVGRAIERLDFLWFEDPLNEEDIYAYVKLKQKLDIPILARSSHPRRSLPQTRGSPRVAAPRKPVSVAYRTVSGMPQPKRKLENSERRLAPQSHRSRPKSPEFPDQRLRRTSLTPRNVGGSLKPGNCIVETALRGWAWRIRTGKCHFEGRLLKGCWA